MVGFGIAHEPPILKLLTARSLAWFPEHDLGWFPAVPGPATYGRAYFDKYAAYAETEMGRRLNAARIALVERHHRGELVDIGIGCGGFVAARPNTFGYDVNPIAVDWLRQRDLWWNPYQQSCRAASMWDVLEHVADFPKLLAQVRDRVFVSLPIFRGLDHVLASKHFRRDEHYWYFTRDGFLRAMAGLGWESIEVNHAETALGREDILSFAFARRERAA
jgi:hypothetical protein